MPVDDRRAGGTAVLVGPHLLGLDVVLPARVSTLIRHVFCPLGLPKYVSIMRRGVLADDELSHRPLDTPDYRVWRLDDVLFETLQVLAE